MSSTYGTFRTLLLGTVLGYGSLSCSSSSGATHDGSSSLGTAAAGSSVQAGASGATAGRAAGSTATAAGRGSSGLAVAGVPGVGASGAGGVSTAAGSGGAQAGQTAAAGSGGTSSVAGSAGSIPAAGTAGSTPAAGSAGTAAGVGGSMSGANDLWIAPSGSDSADGSQATPLQTLAAAVQRAKPGSTIWVTAGTYPASQTVPLKATGQADRPLRVFAAEGARPVFDFAGQTKGSSSARGIQISGEYWHLRGFDVINAGDNCIHISGSHNTIENVVTHHCSDTGLQITADSSDAADPNRAAYNTVLNCDSHDNYDEANQGENADGFAAKLYIGQGNVFRGCRAWNNADDGWDLFASDDVVVIEDCWAIANGKIGATQNNTNGDGNGFKLGGAARAGDSNMGGAVHKVKNCASIENRACGFVRNNNTQVPALSMCGGRGDGKGTFCSLTSTGSLSTSMSAADAIAAQRDASGNLPPLR